MVSSSSKAFRPTALSLPCQEGPLGVGEADAPSSESVLEQSVLGLQEFDDDQLMTMNPTCGDHQQKRQQRWHRADAFILPSCGWRICSMREFACVVQSCVRCGHGTVRLMRELLILAIDLLVTLVKLLRPGGRAVAGRVVVAEASNLISNRSRHRAPNLTMFGSLGVRTDQLFLSPRRFSKLGALIKPATPFKFNALVERRRVARQVSPPCSRRTGREARASYGFHHGTTPGHQRPMSKQRGIAPGDPGYRAAC